jgi:hypothetical protein
VQGLAAVIIDGKEHAVFANIVGDIKPEKLALLGEKLNIDPLKQIGHATEKHVSAEPSTEKPEKQDNP